MRCIFLYMALALVVIPIRPQEREMLITRSASGLLIDEEAEVYLLPRLNSHEIALTRRYIENEMGWLKHFHDQAFTDPQSALTYADKIMNQRKRMRAILDYMQDAVNSKERPSKLLKYGECFDCIPDLPKDRGLRAWKDDSKEKNKKVVIPMFLLTVVVVGCFLDVLLNYPDELVLSPFGQCRSMGEITFFNSFLSNCTASSLLHNTPVNFTELQETYRATAQIWLESSCRKLANEECSQWAIDDYKHAYPKQLLRAVLPTGIIAPCAILACVGSQILACKYRKWKSQVGELAQDVDDARKIMNQALEEIQAKHTQPDDPQVRPHIKI